MKKYATKKNMNSRRKSHVVLLFMRSIQWRTEKSEKKSWQVWDFWYEDNMVMRPSYLNDGTSCTGKMIFNILKLPPGISIQFSHQDWLWGLQHIIWTSFNLLKNHLCNTTSVINHHEVRFGCWLHVILYKGPKTTHDKWWTKSPIPQLCWGP